MKIVCTACFTQNQLDSVMGENILHLFKADSLCAIIELSQQCLKPKHF